MIDWNDLTAKVHENAVTHGWWDKTPTFGEIVALCHSELSEALEQLRAGNPMLWHDYDQAKRQPKPEGVAVELADCILRILDWIGHENLPAGEMIAKGARSVTIGTAGTPGGASLAEHIARWHLLLSMAYDCAVRCPEAAPSLFAAARMALCVCEILDWAEKNGVDMPAVLAEKHAYNLTRPFRHGGKAL